MSSMAVTAVLLTAAGNINVGTYVNIYKLVWFKLGMVIDTIDFNIFILVIVTLILIQGLRRQDSYKQNFCPYFLTKFSVDLD